MNQRRRATKLDPMTAQQRSRCMSRIRGRDTGPEVRLRKALWSSGVRYRLRSQLPGHPDLVFHRARVAVFVDGCFWHGCPQHFVQPRSNGDFWRTKLERNIARDREVDVELAQLGWKAVRVWEHEIDADPTAAAESVIRRAELRQSRYRCHEAGSVPR